ncbi:MAG: toll/interleukin-1 receptor domain-containing protein, partial [Oscillospiraceae bacterium]|nr:toll/interleukin-1 receptor domain-containing protein [Oscillospiraceae bacterium]
IMHGFEFLFSLFSEKYRVWYDEGIAPGSEWPKNIEEHLRAAAAVVVFVSEASLASPNCENEVANAKANSRPVYQFVLGKQPHPGLSNCKTVRAYDELRTLLDDMLIGDGVTGYERGIVTAKNGNLWTSIIAVAVCLMVALGVSLFGLNAGWFDSMLPGRESMQAVTQQKQEVVQMDSNTLTHSVITQTNQNLMEEIPFATSETQELMYNAVGYYQWGKLSPMTYADLTTCYIEELWLDNPNDELLTYMQYLPQLRSIFMQGGDNLTTLEPLLACAELEIVYLKSDVFPVTIPENAPFTVIYIN